MFNESEIAFIQSQLETLQQIQFTTRNVQGMQDYSIDREHGLLYLLTDLYKDTTVEENFPLCETELQAMVIQVLNALDGLHEQKVSHNNLNSD